MATPVEIRASDNAATPLFPTAASVTAPSQVFTSDTYTNITASGTTVVSAVPCTLVRIETGNAGTTNAVVIYDNTVASGTKISTTTAWTDRSRTYGITCATGCTITASATCDLTVVTRAV